MLRQCLQSCLCSVEDLDRTLGVNLQESLCHVKETETEVEIEIEIEKGIKIVTEIVIAIVTEIVIGIATLLRDTDLQFDHRLGMYYRIIFFLNNSILFLMI